MSNKLTLVKYPPKQISRSDIIICPMAEWCAFENYFWPVRLATQSFPKVDLLHLDFIAILLQALLMHVITQQPEDPISYFHEEITKIKKEMEELNVSS